VFSPPCKRQSASFFWAPGGQSPAASGNEAAFAGSFFASPGLNVLRRRTEFLLSEARGKSAKHTVEGLLIAQINIDEVIEHDPPLPPKPGRKAASDCRPLVVPGELIARALGRPSVTKSFRRKRGNCRRSYSLVRPRNPKPSYRCSSVRWQGALKRRQAGGRNFVQLLRRYPRISATVCQMKRTSWALVRQENGKELKTKYGDKRPVRTITDEGAGDGSPRRRPDRPKEKTMARHTCRTGATSNGWSFDTYKAQERKKARADAALPGPRPTTKTPIEHLFVAPARTTIFCFSPTGARVVSGRRCL